MKTMLKAALVMCRHAIGLQAWVVGFAVLIVLAMPASRANANACCNAQNAKCESFCRSPEGQAQGQACWNTCASRVASCLVEGVYAWKNSPSVNCFTSKAGTCASGRITCAAWCAKYKGNSEVCLKQGCLKEYGSFSHCVFDRPRT